MINLTKFGRFFIGSGVGAVLDFGVGASLIFFGASLSVATVVGFTAGVLSLGFPNHGYGEKFRSGGGIVDTVRGVILEVTGVRVRFTATPS